MHIFWPLLLEQTLAMGEGFSWEIVLACLFRIPRFSLYYGIIVTGVSLFNGKF